MRRCAQPSSLSPSFPPERLAKPRPGLVRDTVTCGARHSKGCLSDIPTDAPAAVLLRVRSHACLHHCSVTQAAFSAMQPLPAASSVRSTPPDQPVHTRLLPSMARPCLATVCCSCNQSLTRRAAASIATTGATARRGQPATSSAPRPVVASHLRRRGSSAICGEGRDCAPLTLSDQLAPSARSALDARRFPSSTQASPAPHGRAVPLHPT